MGNSSLAVFTELKNVITVILPNLVLLLDVWIVCFTGEVLYS